MYQLICLRANRHSVRTQTMALNFGLPFVVTVLLSTRITSSFFSQSIHRIKKSIHPNHAGMVQVNCHTFKFAKSASYLLDFANFANQNDSILAFACRIVAEVNQFIGHLQHEFQVHWCPTQDSRFLQINSHLIAEITLWYSHTAACTSAVLHTISHIMLQVMISLEGVKK